MYCPRNKPKKQSVLLLSALLLFSGNSMAQSTGQSKVVAKTQPQRVIDISSATLLLDDNQGLSEYKGKVLFKQNTLTVKADAITLYHKDKKLVKALISGSPADVMHHPDNEAEVHSQAKQMEYYVAEDRLVLIGNAFVTQGDRNFSGEHIVYNTRQRTITAGSRPLNESGIINPENTQPNGRVHVIIGPTTNAKETVVNE